MPLSEEHAIDLVLLSLGQAFQRRGSDVRGVDRTHLVKAVFQLADEFDLPIARCWFKFGQFVISERANPDRLFQLAPGRLGDVSRVLQERLVSDLRILQQELSRAAEGFVSFFREPLDEFLPSYYATAAPQEFVALYVANFELVSLCRRLQDIDDYRGRRLFNSENLRPKLVQYHKAVARVVSNPAELGTVIGYWLLLEELVLRMDFQMARADFDLQAWKSFFGTVVDRYVREVWSLPAAVIASQTVIGPGAEDWRRQMASVLAGAERIRQEVLEPLREQADSLGFLPSPEETGQGLAEARRRIGTRAEAIDQFISMAHTDEQ